MQPSRRRRLRAFAIAALAAIAWGVLVQTQYNLAVLAELGAAVDLRTRVAVHLHDLLRASPVYALAVLPALAIAFALVAWPARRWPGAAVLLRVLGGTIAVVAVIHLVNALVPVAVLWPATRELGAVLWMAAGGGLAGALYTRLRGR